MIFFSFPFLLNDFGRVKVAEKINFCRCLRFAVPSSSSLSLRKRNTKVKILWKESHLPQLTGWLSRKPFQKEKPEKIKASMEIEVHCKYANVDAVCTSFYEWAPILKIILESGLAPPFCLPRQSQDISSAPNGRHALHPEIKRREQISLESSIWYKEATLQFDCWLLKKKEIKKTRQVMMFT